MNFLFKQVDISGLVFFRVMFGILGFADILGSWIGYVLIDDAYNSEKFHFKYYGFEWVEVLPEPFLTFYFFSMMIAALFIAFGKWYKVMTTYFAFGFLYFFLMEKSHYLNHGYLFTMVCFLMIFLPANRAFSYDVIKNPSFRVETVENWSLFILKFMMGIVYFFGGIAKINQDWLQAIPLKYWLRSKKDMFLLGKLWEQEWVAWMMSYGGLLLDLTVVFFLLNKKTRWWALYFILFFHSTNIILFMIGIFPFLSVTLTLLYFGSDFPKRTWAWLKERYEFPEKIENWRANFLQRKNYHPIKISQAHRSSSFYKNLIAGFLIVFCTIQLLLPLRHHLFKGKVVWTEEGHRYSWRMMLRSKQGHGVFKIKSFDGEKSERINPREFLNRRQHRKLFGQPDMILQFAHFLEKKFEDEWEQEVQVFANIKTSVNGRPRSPFVDPERDLTQVKWEFFKSADWIGDFPEGKPRD